MSQTFEPCPPCKIIIDGGALIAAATGLAFQVIFNTAADLYAAAFHKDRSADQIERSRALSEYDCKLAAFLRDRTAYLRLSRAGSSDGGVDGVHGGEYEGEYEIDVVSGIRKK